MTFKKALFFCFFIPVYLIAMFSFSGNDEDPIEKMVASLQKWTGVNPQEKVYLHMDKPYYALGDTIWFKAYVTVGSRHQLSAISGALYVDLVNEKDSIEKTLKLPVTAGMVMGDFTLDDTFDQGNYRLRAYTQWMRNAGEEYFYDHTFVVGNAFDTEIIAKIDYQYKSIDNKPSVIAVINYKDDEGNALNNKEVKYDIVTDGNIIATNTAKTDGSGNMVVNIANNQKSDFKGSYIRTSIQTENKKKIVNIFAIKAALSQSDVQFFPESGNLVNGIPSKVAFKAVGVDGLGIDIKGVVTDSQDKEVVRFESEHAGMGVFNLRPETGKTYRAKISYKDGSEANVVLPKAEDEGYVLAVYQNVKDSLLVRINASANLVQNSHPMGLIAQLGGETLFAAQVKISKTVNSVWLSKKDFPAGIAQFTLFSSAGDPLNERIVFIRNDDQMQLKLSSGKQVYKPREKVEMELETKDRFGKPVAGNFSVSVIDESKVPFDETLESTIFSNILLTSDLRGYIEKPNYYFTKETEEVNKALDNLMLTQGYRRFVWKEILKPEQLEPHFKAELLGTEIAGKVVSLSNKPVVKGKVTLMSLNAGIVKDTITDANGRFKFSGLVLTDGIKFAVQARTAKNGKQVEIMLDSVESQGLTRSKNIADINTDITGSTKTYLENSRKQDEVVQKSGGLSRVQRLKEVNIRVKKRESEKYTSQGMLIIPEGHADQTYTLENPQACASLGICLQGRLHGVVFRQKDGITNYPFSVRGGPMQLILDGRKLSDEEIGSVLDGNFLDPTDIAKIEVVRTNRALLTILGGGSLLIITKKGYLRNKRYTPSIVNIQLKGYNKAREFYSPQYDQPQGNNQLPDFRSTIYWNPSVKSFDAGKARFNFFNGDGPGNYKVVIEGINATGELGRYVYRYQVE